MTKNEIAAQEAFEQRQANAPTLKIGDKVYYAARKITGTVVEFTAPFMGCACVRLAFETRTLDTLKPMSDHIAVTTCDLVKVS